MTDVIVQHLITDKKVRIRCRDYIKKIAVYQDRLAVQLPSRVIIYELKESKDKKKKSSSSKDEIDPSETNMHYTSKTKINQTLEGDMSVVTSQHIMLVQSKRLQLYNFKGIKEREWVLGTVKEKKKNTKKNTKKMCFFQKKWFISQTQSTPELLIIVNNTIFLFFEIVFLLIYKIARKTQNSIY